MRSAEHQGRERSRELRKMYTYRQVLSCFVLRISGTDWMSRLSLISWTALRQMHADASVPSTASVDWKIVSSAFEAI